MSELSFTKSFLSTLDSRPVKLRADHVFNPEEIGLRVPVSSSFTYPFPSFLVFSVIYRSRILMFWIRSTLFPASKPLIQRCRRK